MAKPIEIKESGIMCDNLKCDFEDRTLILKRHHIGMTCPRCNSNMLTEEEFNSLEQLRELTKIINSMEFPDISSSEVLKTSIKITSNRDSEGNPITK